LLIITFLCPLTFLQAEENPFEEFMIDEPVSAPRVDERRIKGPPLIENGKAIVVSLSKKEILGEGKVADLEEIFEMEKFDPALARRSMFVFLFDKAGIDSVSVSTEGIPSERKGVRRNEWLSTSMYPSSIVDKNGPDYSLFWSRLLKAVLIYDYLYQHEDIFYQTFAFDFTYKFLLNYSVGVGDDKRNKSLKFPLSPLAKVMYCFVNLYYAPNLSIARHAADERDAVGMILSAYAWLKIDESKMVRHYKQKYEMDLTQDHKNHWVIRLTKYYLATRDEELALEWLRKYKHVDNKQQLDWVNLQFKELNK
jgi:hypothetical protein